MKWLKMNKPMKNSEKYSFQDFTRENHRKLIRLAKQNYIFRTYQNFNENERFILWRHDVDMSMHSARRLAKIEQEEGITATYFLHLHNQFYNLLEQEITNCVRDIVKMGHEIGLHFEDTYYGIDSIEALEAHLEFEKQFLQKILGVEIHVFSFHNPNPFALGCEDWQYAGMINTYAGYFKTEVGYCSDSNGIWRVRRLENVLTDATDRCLQILTHPGWWQDVPMAPYERIKRAVQGRADNSLSWYKSFLSDHDRLNIKND